VYEDNTTVMHGKGYHVCWYHSWTNRQSPFLLSCYGLCTIKKTKMHHLVFWKHLLLERLRRSKAQLDPVWKQHRDFSVPRGVVLHLVCKPNCRWHSKLQNAHSHCTLRFSCIHMKFYIANGKEKRYTFCVRKIQAQGSNPGLWDT
jgi:hypothetical protein